MPRFFVPATAVAAGRVRIEGADAAHLARSLRVRVGEVVVVVAGDVEHGAVVDAVSPDVVEGTVRWTRAVTGEPVLAVHVLQAVPKEGMDDAVEALAEVGAASVRPVVTERTVTRPDRDRRTGRQVRWSILARQAAMLSGRGRIPVVHPIARLDEALTDLPPATRILACTASGAAPPLAHTAVDPTRPIAVVIGPEGGLSPADLAVLSRAGAEAVHLGARILRSRLAGTVAVTLVLAAAGDLDGAVAPPPPAAVPV